MIRCITRYVLLMLLLLPAMLPVAADQAGQSLELAIPAIDMSAPIVSVPLRQFHDGSVTWDTSRLYGKVGHFDGTAWFGEAGRIVIGGHSEGSQHRPDVFYKLDEVQIGDMIIVRDGSGEINYQVTERSTVEEEDLSVLEAQGSEQLVLMTCDISSYSGGGRYTRRVIIIASRV